MEVQRGGGWAIKNARCRKHGDLVVGKLEGCICMGVQEPRVSEL